MAEEKNADVVVLPPKVRALVLYTPKANIPKEAHADLIAHGYIPVRVHSIADVKVMPLTVTHEIDAPRLDIVTQAAMQALAMYSTSGASNPNTYFGSKLANLLNAAMENAKATSQAKE